MNRTMDIAAQNPKLMPRRSVLPNRGSQSAFQFIDKTSSSYRCSPKRRTSAIFKLVASTI